MVIKTKKISISLLLLAALLQVCLGSGAVDYSDPSSWGGSCQIGTNQSPININTKTLNFCPKINNDFKFLCVANSFVPKADDIAYTVDSTGSGFIGIKDDVSTTIPKLRLYSSLQYHFHAPSEHTVNG